VALEVRKPEPDGLHAVPRAHPREVVRVQLRRRQAGRRGQRLRAARASATTGTRASTARSAGAARRPADARRAVHEHRRVLERRAVAGERRPQAAGRPGVGVVLPQRARQPAVGGRGRGGAAAVLGPDRRPRPVAQKARPGGAVGDVVAGRRPLPRTSAGTTCSRASSSRDRPLRAGQLDLLAPPLAPALRPAPRLARGVRGFRSCCARAASTFLDYGPGQIAYDPETDTYTADPGRGSAGPYTFGNPDFNFKSLRVNTVLRWEWRPARPSTRCGPRPARTRGTLAAPTSGGPRRALRLALHQRLRGQGHDPPGRLARPAAHRDALAAARLDGGAVAGSAFTCSRNAPARCRRCAARCAR
jgi:hypothetical protein